MLHPLMKKLVFKGTKFGRVRRIIGFTKFETAPTDVLEGVVPMDSLVVASLVTVSCLKLDADLVRPHPGDSEPGKVSLLLTWWLGSWLTTLVVQPWLLGRISLVRCCLALQRVQAPVPPALDGGPAVPRYEVLLHGLVERRGQHQHVRPRGDEGLGGEVRQEEELILRPGARQCWVEIRQDLVQGAAEVHLRGQLVVRDRADVQPVQKLLRPAHLLVDGRLARPILAAPELILDLAQCSCPETVCPPRHGGEEEDLHPSRRHSWVTTGAIPTLP